MTTEDRSGRRIALAAVAGAHGVDGQVRLKLFSEDADSLAVHKSVHVGGTQRKLISVRRAGKGAVARIDGVSDRSAAEALRGTLLEVDRDALPPLEPGEYYHSFNGEYGGLWRRIGRAPNVMAGVGFIAQGFDFSSYYRRAPDADNPRARFIFEGVPDEIIGDFGLVGGGAAGIELDCITTELGSPTNMLRLASSEGHSGLMLLVNEEFGVVPPNLGGDQNERVRADLAFGETPAGGALFATSSIVWCGSLSHNNYDNNVSQIT